MEHNKRTNDPNFQYGQWLSSPRHGEEVVVSGMSGHFPESNNVQELHDNLINKRVLITDDDRRWKVDHPEVPSKNAKIYDIDKLDPGYFGLHYRQAHNMDPLMRMALEATTEAIMDAGMSPKELEGTKTGVFWSAIYSDGEHTTLVNVKEPQSFTMTGYLRSLISHRISYCLKLQGTGCIVDTACSSSLYGLDRAFRALSTGLCEYAIVGGSNLLLHPGVSLQFYRMGVLTMDGLNKVFDQDADGYVKGETVACIFLQKAKTARRIYGTIVNTKINCDGFKERGITFPAMKVQTILMNEIYEESGICPSQLSYVEAHGTATRAGDLEEAEAIDAALAKRRHKPLLVGSVKSNIGHTEASSGVASVIKVLLALETGLIAPNISLKRIKDGMNGFHQGRMVAVTEVTKLKEDDAIIGLNNFGFGGSNCHVIIRRHNKKKINGGKPEEGLPRLICVSARTEQAVQKLLADISSKDFDAEYAWLLHNAYKANIENHLYRGYCIVSNDGLEKISTKLCDFQKSKLYVFFGSLTNNYKVLASYLLKLPTFKNTVSRIDKKLQKNELCFDDIFKNGTKSILGSVCVQIGLLDILKDLELEFEVYGDSFGKLITAYYYGAMTLEEILSTALKIKDFVSELDFQRQISNFYDRKSSEKVRSEPLNHETLQKISQNAVILNVSDSPVNNKDVLLVEGDAVNLLNILGRLYEEGHNPQLHKLYPEIKAPVSRTTPMISPSIRWNHSKSWHTFKVNSLDTPDADQKEFSVSITDDEYKMVSGHVIDGRNLFPATEYLHLVWQTLAESQRFSVSNLPVIFTDCKFIKAVTMPPTGYVKLLVTIQRGSGAFEVLEKNFLVVSGTVHVCKDVDKQQMDLEVERLDEGNPTDVLQKDDIYKELQLRGYNYSGIFKGVEKCNVEANKGLIQWENNWSSFIDKMMQLKLINTDTRLLYVPVGIKRLIIDPVKHLEIADKLGGKEAVFPAQVYERCDLVKSGGIEICGLQVRSIAKRKSLLEPVLEMHDFVPNSGSLDLPKAVRVNTQIILENTLENQFKSVEIIDVCTQPNSEPLLLWVSKSLDDVPVVTTDLTISSTGAVAKIPGVKVQNVILTSDSNYLLIVGTNILQRLNVLKTVLSALKKNGFILTREDLNFTPPSSTDLVILTEYIVGNEKLILLKKSSNSFKTKVVDVANDWSWLQQLQSYAKTDCNVVIHSRIPEHGVLGLVNCIRREAHGDRFKCFFILDEAPKFDPQNFFYDQQLKKDLAVNIYKNNIWGTYRHLHLDESPEIECEHSYVDIVNKGDISSLKWFEGPLNDETRLRNNEVLVTIYYSSINFKDIMLALGRINVEALPRLEQESMLGFEFSGRDRRGRRVTGIVSNKAISSHVVADGELLWEVPDSWSLEDASTVPIVYCTVMYGLLMLINMKPASSILIHSATGGIGLAALNVCSHYKCDIYVTVGNKEKRDYLRKHYPDIPESHIGNSRDTSFEEMINRETRNKGVDIVLNSLSDDKLKVSVRCLRRGGTFLEIGKFDLINNTALNLLLMERESSCHGIAFDRVINTSGDLKARLVNIVKEGIQKGYVKPLPRVVFSREEVEESFRYMMTGKHIGKVVLKIFDEEKNRVVVPKKKLLKATPRFNCDAQYSYIIIGGLGGVGLELVDWLVLRGAKKLVLVSRSGLQTGYQQQRIRIWNSYNVKVRICTHNVTTKQGCTDLLKEANELGPVDAIFNLAVILKDALLEDQTEESFLTSLAPKAQSTQYLDEVSRRLCPKLRYFVVFSSVSCGRGNAGQSNYGMANSIMERICERRKREGLPAVAIQWGAIGDVGLVAKMQKENKELVIAGTLPQRISSCLDVLDKFLKQFHPVVASMVVAEKHSRGGVVSAVEAVAAVIGIKNMKIVSQHSTLAELGMDSMMGTEVVQLLEKDHELFIPVKDVRSLTFAKLAEIEGEYKNASKVDNTKIQQGINLLIQNIPDSTTSHIPFLKLSSQVHEKEEAPTVFILPGIEGVFKLLETFTDQLKAHVVGLQYQYSDLEETIEETAKNIVPNIENNLQKNAPFILIGYSYGAAVCLELARLLENKGRIGKVILIDGSPTYITSSIKESFPHTSETELQTAIIYKIFSIILPVDVLTQHKEKLLSCNTWNDKIDFSLSLIPTDIANREKLDKNASVTLYRRIKAALNYTYTYEKIKSEVYLFKAKYAMVKETEDYQLSALCEKLVLVTEIDGDHVTIISRPELAENMNRIINTL